MTEVEFTIVDMDDKVALKNGIGHDVVWGYLTSGDEATPAEIEAFNEAFEIVKDERHQRDWFHTDGDLYQGSTLMRVIRRKADGRLFGFAYWEGGGKYGEMMVESNGEDHGFPPKYDEDYNTIAEWYVFLPIVSEPLPAYRFADEADAPAPDAVRDKVQRLLIEALQECGEDDAFAPYLDATDPADAIVDGHLNLRDMAEHIVKGLGL